MLEKPLFQNRGSLPVDLRVDHFHEGMLFSLTLNKTRDKPMLVMVILTESEKFIYRVFFCSRLIEEDLPSGRYRSDRKVWLCLATCSSGRTSTWSRHFDYIFGTNLEIHLRYRQSVCDHRSHKTNCIDYNEDYPVRPKAWSHWDFRQIRHWEV